MPLILPAIAQRVGPASNPSMNDANARDLNPLREESSWATEEDVHWLSKNRILGYSKMETFGYQRMEPLAIEEMRSLAIEDGSLWLWENGDFGYRGMGVFWLWSLWLSRNGAFGYRGNEPLAIAEWESLAMESLAIQEWNGVASLGRGLGASRGLVGSSRLNFSRSYSWSVLLFRSL